MVNTIEDFKARWTPKIEEIKKNEFEKSQCFWIASDFLKECLVFSQYQTKKKKSNVPYFEEISNDLNLSLQMAYSNFRRNRMNFWARFFDSLFCGTNKTNFLRRK